MPIAALAVVGGLCLFVALIESWLLVALLAGSYGPLQKLLPNRQDLVRSHIDYLMMALFLFVFYGLCRLLPAAPPGAIIAAACLGAFFNPFAFLVHAMKPAFKEAPPTSFFTAMMASCVATTVGFAGIGWTISAAALSQ